MKERTFTIVIFTVIIITVFLMELCRMLEYGWLVAILICVIYLVSLYVFTKKVKIEVNK